MLSRYGDLVLVEHSQQQLVYSPTAQDVGPHVLYDYVRSFASSVLLSLEIVKVRSLDLNSIVTFLCGSFNFRSDVFPLSVTICPYKQTSSLSTFSHNIIINLFGSLRQRILHHSIT